MAEWSAFAKPCSPARRASPSLTGSQLVHLPRPARRPERQQATVALSHMHAAAPVADLWPRRRRLELPKSAHFMTVTMRITLRNPERSNGKFERCGIRIRIFTFSENTAGAGGGRGAELGNTGGRLEGGVRLSNHGQGFETSFAPAAAAHALVQPNLAMMVACP